MNGVARSGWAACLTSAVTLELGCIPHLSMSFVVYAPRYKRLHFMHELVFACDPSAV